MLINIKLAAPIRKPSGDWARSDRDKGSVFAAHLAAVFQPNPRVISEKEESELLDNTVLSIADTSPFEPVEVREVRKIIKNFSAKKAPGHDRISGKIIKELPPIAIRYLTIVFNACLRLCHFPSQWKEAQIIVLHKPGKAMENASSYRPISLLPVISKIFEKIILARLEPIIINNNLIPDHQFGFKNKHSTVEQVHRIANKICDSFESKKYVSAVFLDVAQAFDRVWHEALLYKIKKSFLDQHYRLIKSYLHRRTFHVRINDEISEIEQINAGVPQGSILAPTLYLVYTADLPSSPAVLTATFADDTALLAAHSGAQMASLRIQNHLDKLEVWLRSWPIKVNGDKSAHITFTLNRETCPPVSLYGSPIPVVDHVKYLGLHLDRRLTWRTHIWAKRKQLGLKLRSLYWLIGRSSPLTLENKILIYRSILRPIWTYGCQLWGRAANSNILVIERYQAKVLRCLVDAPWYVPNEEIRKDLNIPIVCEVIERLVNIHQNKLQLHINPLASGLAQPPGRSRLRKPRNL
ncbi:hypothetical protein TKK_0013026 [Trichogramma kaykai]|uniref:Reverse transcriptase domain-containing protein n=1 Tax=Trichogramma kaykai TaxID=54128 RepID=A0ABD2WJI2_9HYME